MKALNNLLYVFIATFCAYVAAFVVMIIAGANELGGQGSPAWFDGLAYVLIGIAGLLTLWTLVLAVKKLAAKF